jgi:hypothetical protein
MDELRPEALQPNVARMYDYFLGGKDNFAVDRDAAQRAAEAFPDIAEITRSNRRFLTRAVGFMAQSGIRQYLDLGAGIPTSPNVHEVARQSQPEALVAYVDNDPVVAAHTRALRAVDAGVITVEADLRDPAAVLADPALRTLIDFDQPVGLLLVAVLHFVGLDEAPGIVAGYREALPPGSLMAISTACREGTDEAAIERNAAVYSGASAPFVFRSTEQIRQLFGDFELVEPGLRDITRWRANGTPHSASGLCGVGRKL